MTENADTYYIGEIGYYYPAEVWMNAKGEMFSIHDYYEKKYDVFPDFVEFLASEVKHSHCSPDVVRENETEE